MLLETCQCFLRIRGRPLPSSLSRQIINLCCNSNSSNSSSTFTSIHNNNNNNNHQVTVRKMSSEGTGKSEHCRVEEVARAKWICLNKITYKDPNGQERIWEGVSRTTKSSGEADAVGMVAVFQDPVTDLQSVILIRQYRPPMQTYTIEFPAGLIDKGESADVAAVREMKEETGYDVTVVDVSPATSLDPGVGSTTLKIATCKVDTSKLSKDERPKPTGGDSDEFVQVIIQPMNTLMEKLKELAGQGDCVDSRVYTWAAALTLGQL